MILPGPALDLTIVEGGAIFRTGVSRENVREHAHPEVQLSVRVAGERAGLVSLSDTLEPHGGLTLAGELVIFYYEPRYLERLAWDAFGMPALKIDGRRAAGDDVIAGLAADVKDVIASLGYNALSEAVSTVVAGRIVHRCGTTKARRYRGDSALSHRELQRVCERIDDAGLPSPTLAELAELTQMSSFRFARSFAAVMGSTPHRFIMERKVDRALRQLATSRSTIAAIAADCGFANQSHLTRLFRRRHGMTPSQFRANRR